MILNKIYLCDVFEFLPKLDDNSIDLAIIDPPYNLGIANWDIFKTEKAYEQFMEKWLDLMLPKLKSSASFYIFNNAYNSAITLNYLRNKEVYFKNWITWYKKDGFSSTKRKYTNSQETILFYTMSKNNYPFNYDLIRQPYLSTDRIKHASSKGILKNGKRWYPNEKGRLCSDVWEITSQRHKTKVNGKIQKPKHPTQKPIEMIERMILASSNEGDLILDLFSGSGTTSIVAKSLNRYFIGCENNPEYINEIEKEGIEIGIL